MKCVRCNRPLKNAPGPHGMGPTCERSMFGAKPAAVQVERHVTPDEKQSELFPGLWEQVRAYAMRLGAWVRGRS